MTNLVIPELPLAFKGHSVSAMLDDMKTQTRRVVGVGNSTVLGSRVTKKSRTWKGLDWTRVRRDGGPHLMHPVRSQYLHVNYVEPGCIDDGMSYRVRCRFEPGYRIWVKESGGMKRTDSRITLEVTDVRVQQLQDISTNDCWAEGVEPPHYKRKGTIGGDTSVRVCFAEIWDRINDRDGARWKDSPWVWALTFKRLKPI